ncbi:hypothetical protein [Paenibacillus campinasensis]|uniref:Translation initiation factor 2 n=1 Tax=Paenibacillus campinasensis TaxID=66347 RepID=A0A268F4J2_9BACL|nr:hypothetical protein [Paenibacillus campinasensis]PAD80293.1 hypothetical protein CHH67_00865 [Paenibacillus campinasensis]
MSRAAKRFVALLIWAGIGVLIGMQLGGGHTPANELNGRVQEQEPITEDVVSTGWGGNARLPQSVEGYDDTQAEAVETKPKFEPAPRDILLPDRPKPPADVLADKTAGLLQELSDQGIRWVVSMFGSIIE